MNMPSFTCFIFARKASRRLPGKNRRVLGESPLFQYAVEAARDSGVFRHIVFSTDDEEILEALQSEDGLVADRRPENLADSLTTMPQVGRHLLGKYPEIAEQTDALCFLTPCNPFRTAKHVAEAASLYAGSGAQALCCVTRYPSPPGFSVRIDKRWVEPLWSEGQRRSDFEDLHYPNGAVVFVDREYFQEHGNFYPERTVAYELSWPYSLDIDTIEDLEMACAVQGGLHAGCVPARG